MEEECCPKFNPDKWDGKVFNWKGKKFIRGKVATFFYMPLNFGGVITKLMKLIDSTNAKCPDNLCLSEHASKWNMNIYVAVDKKIEGAENSTIYGKFLTKVYEGNFKETGKWCKDFEEYAKSKKLRISRQYMWYTTCPKCAKKYGKNYVAIFGQIA